MLTTLQKSVSRKLYGRPSGQWYSPFVARPLSSLASLAALGAGVSMLFSARIISQQPLSEEEEWSRPSEKSYFTAAPRSVSGSHGSFADYAGERRMPATGGSLLIGSAAALTAIYLLGRRR